jgi:hypothetical protein
MAGLILRERFIADRSRTISGPARQSGCAAWSFDFTLRLSAKHLSKLATYFDSFRSTCRRYRHIPNDMSKSSKYFDINSAWVEGFDTLGGKHLQKGGMLVQNLAALLFGGQDANSFQFLKIHRSRLPLGDPGLHQKLDLAIGLGENEFDQLL